MRLHGSQHGKGFRCVCGFRLLHDIPGLQPGLRVICKDTVVNVSGLTAKMIESMSDRPDILYSRSSALYTFLNPVSYLKARNNSLFLRFDGIMLDGQLLALAVRLFYGKRLRRRSFDMTSLADGLFRHARDNGETICLVGGKEDEAERTACLLKQRYSGIRIAGCWSGYFGSAGDRVRVRDAILKLQPDYVIAGMGSVLQEEFLVELKDSGYGGIGITCGAFISQTGRGSLDYYPPIVDRLHLRAAYRFLNERHTRLRYVKALALFPAVFMADRLRNVVRN